MEPLPCDLVLDRGNSRLKVALFGPFGAVRRTVLAPGDLAALRHWLGADRPQGIVLGSVAAADPGLEQGLADLAPLLVVDGSTPAPVRTDYTTPLTLGVDRLANAVGAMSLFPGRAVIAIDLGTCITYDLVDQEGVYRGGLITPGMTMRARAMHAYSARLPLVGPGPAPRLVGRSTTESLEAGVHHGVWGELRALIDALVHEMPGAVVVLTGGDALRFARALKSGIFADPLLTLSGLHALLLHNRSLAARPAGDPGGAARSGPVGD